MPTRGDNGQGMRPLAIHVAPDKRDDKLDTMSRIDFGKVSTIQHNIKVKPFGMVTTETLGALVNQFKNVWLRQIEGPRAGPSTKQQGGKAPTTEALVGVLDPRAASLIQTLVEKGYTPENARALVAQKLNEPGAQTMKGKQAVIPQTQAVASVGATSADQRKIELYRQLLEKGYSQDQAKALLVKSMAAYAGQAETASQPAVAEAEVQENNEDEEEGGD